MKDPDKVFKVVRDRYLVARKQGVDFGNVVAELDYLDLWHLSDVDAAAGLMDQ